MSGELMDASEIAQMCGVTRRTVYNLVDRGELPTPHRFGNSIRFKRAEILAWYAAARAKPKAKRYLSVPVGAGVQDDPGQLF